ncbi:MAG: hypothetical protein ACYTG5_09425 [Planctomycetota bacterium]|jgi:hypothetical protein
MSDADQSLARSETRKLIHLMNNLLSVIQTQADVARLAASEDACQKALEVIAASGERATREMAQIRSQLEKAQSRSASSD